MEDPSHLTAWLDQEDRRTTETIRTYGVYIQYVIGDPPRQETSFSYTTGLFGLAHPELLVFGLPPATAHALLNHLAGRVRDGHDLIPGEMLTFDDWPHRVVPEAVPNPGQILLAANRFYQRPPEHSVPALQLTTDDRGGRFPWDDGYEFPAWLQPRPGEFSA